MGAFFFNRMAANCEAGGRTNLDADLRNVELDHLPSAKSVWAISALSRYAPQAKGRFW